MAAAHRPASLLPPRLDGPRGTLPQPETGRDRGSPAVRAVIGAPVLTLRDRPAFLLGRKAVELNAVEAVATDDTLLVLERQSGELNPRRPYEPSSG